MPALPWTTIHSAEADRTYTVMASRLPLRGYRYIPRFLAQTMKIRRQLAATEGIVGYALDAKLTRKEFWTVSVWESREHLERFAAADPHASIIRTKPQRMRQSKFVFWTSDAAGVPVPWSVVSEKLAA